MEKLVISKGKEIALEEGLLLHFIDRDCRHTILEYGHDGEWLVCWDIDADNIIHWESTLNYRAYDLMDQQQYLLYTLRKKWLGFDPDQIVDYCEAAYATLINPIPEIRKKFPQQKWKFSCTANSVEDGETITVHKDMDRVYLTWHVTGSYVIQKHMDAAKVAAVRLP